MSLFRLCLRRQWPAALSHLLRSVRLPYARRLHGSTRLRQDQSPWSKARSPEQHYQLTDLDKADALMLRKSHETAFFILGGVCVSFGGASYISSLFALRRMMLLSVPAFLLQAAVVSSVALFWLCAVSLYIGRLEVEIIHEDDDEEECRECRERREQRDYRNNNTRETTDRDSKGPDK
uniref:Transmembrane protein 160 n=1 Tax=Knipowitschia caucasica TaxID=637954 RepID=A0AAV2J266_KNICA